MPNNFKSLLLVLIQFGCITFIVVYAGVQGSVLQNVISVLALLLGMWAIVIMKFSVNVFPDVKDKQLLYSNGPYRFIRHPMYTAVLLSTFAWIFNRLDMITIIVWIVLLTNLLIKISYEETLLIKKFNNYRTYQKKTTRLIPYIY